MLYQTAETVADAQLTKRGTTEAESIRKVLEDQKRRVETELGRPNDPAAIGARSRLKGDVKAVIFGHTHEALKTEFAEGMYMNSGTWADLVALPQDGTDAMMKWLDEVAVNNRQGYCSI